jgi:predicted nuclease with RNAse H fold
VSDFDHLGEQLRERLHASVEDLHPSAELLATVDALPTSAPRARRFSLRRPSRRIAVSVPVPLAALAAGAVLLFGSSGVSSSIAHGIVVLRNGAIRITPVLTNDPSAANALLRRHHIHNIVDVPMTASCHTHLGMTYLLGYDRDGLNRAPLETLTPSTSARGYTIVIASKEVAHDSELMAVGRFRGKLPTCVSSHGTGPGMGDALPVNTSGSTK